MLLLLLLACKPAPDPLPNAVGVLSDSGNERVVYTKLVDRSVVYELDLRVLHPDDCGTEYGGTAPESGTCLPFQTDPEVVTDETGTHDELVLEYDRQARDDEFYERAVIERVRLQTGGAEIRWRLDTLDFVTNYADRTDICAHTDPCQLDAGDEQLEAALRCRLAHSHDFDVLAEDDTSVDLLIADTSNERVLTVHLDKATTCGVVTDVMADSTVAAWSAGRTPNDVDAVPLDEGGTGVLVTFRSSNADVISNGGDGNGFVMLYTPGTSGWDHTWTFPATGFLNSPHDTSIIRSASGARFLVGSHSDGNGEHLQADWLQTTDSLGSISVAALPDLYAAPDYRYDVVLDPTDDDPGIGFLRSAQPFNTGVDGPADKADTNWILADSGCMSEQAGCPHTPGIRALQFDLDDPLNGDGTGAFVVGRGEQTFLTAQPNGAALNCGFGVPYIVDLLWSTGEGIPAGGERCEE